MRRVDQDVGAELLGVGKPVVAVVRHHDRADATRLQRGHRRQADGARTDDQRQLARLDARTANVELPHRECVHHRDRVVRYAVGHLPRHHLRDQHQLAERAGRVRIVSDHVAAPRRARIRIGMLVTRMPTGKSSEQSGPWPTTSPMNSWPMTVSRSASHTNRRRGVRMVHVVHVRRADRRAERLDQQFAATRHRIGGLPHLEPAVAQHDGAHQPRSLLGGEVRRCGAHHLDQRPPVDGPDLRCHRPVAFSHRRESGRCRCSR